MTMPNLPDEEIADQVEKLRGYLEKEGNQGALFWLNSKGFTPADKLTILTRLKGEG